ncbi:LuxR C-terminal-related transcriptional regulator [Micromonospora peucetia]|uniref:AAA ATPase domain-containing protein n=1 Tax=Micromonospora peucetia TaxID=47871 RepID=A0A1C6W4Q0_9ACTN|nr:LuxR C-terminal-related transcriptional regulator [Micromonospora peucetia]SCL73496.1 AAA ATPase domain-containing protein [Micromonospora peucetia]
MSRPAGESPLTGRDEELADAVRALWGPAAPGLLIAGPAGVGKTRLAREAATRVRGRRILSVQCSADSAGLALGALAGLLPADAGLAAGQGPLQLGLLALRRLADQGPILLSVDDAHQLDPVSLAVLHQAVVENVVALLATMRTDEPIPDVLTALWKDAGVVRIDLAVLDAPTSDALLTAMLDGPVEGQALRRLRDTAAGNPLFLRELVTSAREAGVLDRADGLWRLTGPMTAMPRLSELLRSRLAASDPVEREALELVAAGEPVPLPVAVAIAGDRILEALERRGLITVEPVEQPMVRLSHPLYGELLRADTPALGRLRHIRRLADAVEAGGTPGEDELLRIARWRLDAGGPVNPQLMLAAAEQAALTREYALAYRLAERAYRAGAAVDAGLAAVRALVHLGHIDEAIALCAELAATAGTASAVGTGPAAETARAGGATDRIQVAIQHAEILVHAVDDVRAARAVLDGASQPPDDEATGTGPLAGFDLYLRSYQLDCTVIEPALAVFRGANPVATRLAASCAAGCAMLLAGRLAEAEELIAETVPLAHRHTGPSQMQSLGVPPIVAVLRCYRPDPAGAREMAERGYEASLHPTNPVSQALHALTLAQIALFAGRPGTALRWAQEARLVAGEIGMRPVYRWAAGVRMQASVQLGGDTDLAALAADLHQHAAGPHSLRLFDIEVARAHAWRGAAENDGGAGITALVEAVVGHGRRGAVAVGALGALDLVRLGAAGRAAELLASHPPDPRWSLGRTIEAYATAARTADAGTLLDVAARFARYGMPLHAAEAATMAGAARMAGGQPTTAARAYVFADTQLALIGEPVSTPALRRRGPITRLTGREHEIVLAAARGEQSRNIAVRLHLSERTVENHLHRAYGKLGIGGRAELRGALGLD